MPKSESPFLAQQTREKWGTRAWLFVHAHCCMACGRDREKI